VLLPDLVILFTLPEDRPAEEKEEMVGSRSIAGEKK